MDPNLQLWQFGMEFPPQNDLRTACVVYALETLRNAFRISSWQDHDGEILNLTATTVEALLKGKWKNRPPSTGGHRVFGPSSGNPLLNVTVSTGSDEYVWDFLSVDFRDSDPVPDLSYFRQCIETCGPAVADLSHFGNEVTLHSGQRAYAQSRKFKEIHRPVVVHWFHYWNLAIAKSFGGIKLCLQTPAYKVEEFADGVLVQLTEQPLDPNNENHLLAQRKAMEHLGLPWDFTPPPRTSSFFPK